MVKLLPIALALVLSQLPLSSVVYANDFPTQARVEYVMRCMDSHGGQKYENLYSCVCVVDKIADKFSYDEYVEGEVFNQLRRTPGERGGVFRDPDRASILVKKITDVTAAAEKTCFFKTVSGATN